MLNRSIRVARWLTIAAMLCAGLSAMAQAEPTIAQVYEAAQAGRLEQAQVMMQQVLVAHPSSARAYFVQAELYARQGQQGRGREALASAEKLAPGLPFAKPEAVQSLRAQLAGTATVVKASPMLASPAAPAAAPFPWGIALLIGGGLIAFAIYKLGKRPQVQPAYANPADVQTGLSGPQSFGGVGGSAMAPGYGQPAYGQPGYGQPAGSGIGGKVMGGLATGLAVGAGVMAAQAIGNSLMGGNHSPHPADGNAANGTVPPATNSDLGGQNFGVADAGSWDDGNSFADNGGGGDWDS